MKNLTLLILFLFGFVVLSCSSYKKNAFIKPDKVQRIRLGMHSEEVERILGQPYIELQSVDATLWKYFVVRHYETEAKAESFIVRFRDNLVFDFDGRKYSSQPLLSKSSQISSPSKTKEIASTPPSTAKPEVAPVNKINELPLPEEKRSLFQSKPIESNLTLEQKQMSLPVQQASKTSSIQDFNSEIYSFKTIADMSGNCNKKPKLEIGCIVHQCENSQWTLVCAKNPYNFCGPKPNPQSSCQIGRCINGQWEQQCS